MSRFATGMVAGGIVAAIGVSFLLSDERSRRRVCKSSRRAMRKAVDMFNDMNLW